MRALERLAVSVMLATGGGLLIPRGQSAPADTVPQKTICASALAFGGEDARTLYITACDAIYAIPLKAPGILEGPAERPRRS